MVREQEQKQKQEQALVKRTFGPRGPVPCIISRFCSRFWDCHCGDDADYALTLACCALSASSTSFWLMKFPAPPRPILRMPDIFRRSNWSGALSPTGVKDSPTFSGGGGVVNRRLIRL